MRKFRIFSYFMQRNHPSRIIANDALNEPIGTWSSYIGDEGSHLHICKTNLDSVFH